MKPIEIRNWLGKPISQGLMLWHAYMVIRVLVMSLAATGVWYFVFWRHNIHLPKADEFPIAATAVVAIVLIFGLVGTATFNSRWERYCTICDCVQRSDKTLFLQMQHRRIPGWLHGLLFLLAMLLLTTVALLQYESVWSGTLAISSIAFTLTGHWTLNSVLDDPVKFLLFDSIPGEWLETQPSEMVIVTPDSDAAKAA